MGVTTEFNDSKRSNITSAFNEIKSPNNNNVKQYVDDIIDVICYIDSEDKKLPLKQKKEISVKANTAQEMYQVQTRLGLSPKSVYQN